MKPRFHFVISVAISILCVRALLYAGLQDANDHPPKGSAPVSAYPESESGLKSFLGDMLAVVKSGDQEAITSHLLNFTIPDHSAWFVNIFGPDEGHRLESKYAELLPNLPNRFVQRLRSAIVGQRSDVQITVFQKPVDPSARLAHAISEAMVQPISFYSANAFSSDQQSSTYLGYFVYVDGTFHYVDPEVYQALSTMPPLRVRQGSSVTAAAILRQDAPIYPAEARAERIEGDVVLHVIIDVHGAVKNIEKVSGDPLLVEAAIDAVKNWAYKPTLLNGSPVEVDTNITVHFRFNR